jgi:hypothetical protein
MTSMTPGAQVLLKAGCSRDARTKVDKTPLHVAAQEGNMTICQLLLEQGADVDAKDMVSAHCPDSPDPDPDPDGPDTDLPALTLTCIR